MTPDQYPNYNKALQIYTGCFDSLDIRLLFSYPSSIIVTRDYCISVYRGIELNCMLLNVFCVLKNISNSSYNLQITKSTLSSIT